MALQMARERIGQLTTVLARPPAILSLHLSRRTAVNSSGSSGQAAPKITIGDISMNLHKPTRPESVPIRYVRPNALQSQDTLRNLRWMLQKDILGQDMFLIGPPGPERRRLALQYCEITNRDVEYLAISRDTTEADLKQRREIRGGFTKYFDQCAVRAATEGKVLILEGIEKAERNVLPVLNNLLENREMQLEDGRFLLSPSRYDELAASGSKAELDTSKFVRVDERFRIIALGLPVPYFPGNPLDPPLRSRFQARDVSTEPYDSVLERLATAAPRLAEKDPTLLERVASVHATLRELRSNVAQDEFGTGSIHVPEVSTSAMEYVVSTMDAIPNAHFGDVFHSVCPYRILLPPAGVQTIESTLQKFDLHTPCQQQHALPEVTRDQSSSDKAHLTFESANPLAVPIGMSEFGRGTTQLVSVAAQQSLLHDMLMSHAKGDLCLVGPRGSGKTAVVDEFARLLGYSVQPVLLHKDMTARDLLQTRGTDATGDTVWRFTPLITAALDGSLAVLDGAHRVDPSTIAILQRLAQDREVVLHDGTHLMGKERYDACREARGFSDDEMVAAGFRQIHPAFRMIALGEDFKQTRKGWLTDEIASMFFVHEVPALSLRDNRCIVRGVCPMLPETSLDALMRVLASAETRAGDDLLTKAVTLSTRQVVRIARRLERYPDEHLGNAIDRACLGSFLPLLAKQSLERLLSENGLVQEASSPCDIQISTETDGSKQLRIGDVVAPILGEDESSAMRVPSTLFYENRQHALVMREMLKDLQLGEHLLLVGNQGVGKNKIVDRLLELLNTPRYYIQLHRDTTVQTLTQQPSVEDGRIVYHPSPLVRAVQEGSILVVDEADKAPTHVTCVLKSLVEAGDMTLSDGRRIVPHDFTGPNTSNVIRTHPNFRMIVLANRPGFPFLGNDFYGSIGDVFGTHAVNNPSLASELEMLTQYGPSIDVAILKKLVEGFAELRRLSDEGTIAYPFSLRELVSIVIHLEKYPTEGLGDVVRNVFDFDSYDHDMRQTIVHAFRKHGIPIGASRDNVRLAREEDLSPAIPIENWRIGHSPQTACAVSTTPMTADPPVELKQYAVPIDKSDGRSNHFGELSVTFTCPFHEHQRMVGVDVAQNGHFLCTAIRPLQFFNFSIWESWGNTPTEVSVYDLDILFPRYYGSLKLAVASVAPALENHAAVFDEAGERVILINMTSAQAQIIQLPLSSKTVQNSKPGGQGWIMKSNLSDGGELVFFQPCGDRIVVLDILSRLVSTVHLPTDTGVAGIHIPQYGSWMLRTVDPSGNPTLHALSSQRPTDTVPNMLTPIGVSSQSGIGKTSLPDIVASSTSVGQADGSRALASADYYGGHAINLCEILNGVTQKSSILAHPRPDRAAQSTAATWLPETDTIIQSYASQLAEQDQNSETYEGGHLEVVDLQKKSLRTISIPATVLEEPGRTWNGAPNLVLAQVVGVSAGLGGSVVTADQSGTVHVFDLDAKALKESYREWRKMVGEGKDPLSLEYTNVKGRSEYERFSGLGNKEPKHGKEDPHNKPHVGGNTWAGGSGGRDTAGLGGKGGPYRLDKGHDVHQLSDEEKDAVPEHIKQAAREMGQKAFAERLAEINMSEYDAKVYDSVFGKVQREIRDLKVTLAGLEARGDERVWIKNQSDGDLDDGKLIDGLTGEQTIYKRRGTEEPEVGATQKHPKRLTFVVDVSGSMYRFNGHDQRLERMLEAACLVMESFAESQPGKFAYEIIGHSGESFDIPFVSADSPPANNHDRLKVLQAMYAHSQFCMSGDNTLQATLNAVERLDKRKDADERFVIVLSDANLDRYGIHPSRLGSAMLKSPEVKTFCIMIGSLGQQAEHLKSNLPPGRSFVCMDTSDLPKILKRIFSDVMLQ